MWQGNKCDRTSRNIDLADSFRFLYRSLTSFLTPSMRFWGLNGGWDQLTPTSLFTSSFEKSILHQVLTQKELSLNPQETLSIYTYSRRRIQPKRWFLGKYCLPIELKILIEIEHLLLRIALALITSYPFTLPQWLRCLCCFYSQLCWEFLGLLTICVRS